MAFFQTHQLNLMLVLSGICAILAILTLLTKALTPKRKTILLLMEIGAMLLLIADRYAYIYHGDVSTLGYWMVRICNFLVYFLSLCLPFGFNLYLCDLYKNEGGLEHLPKRLLACKIMFAIGVLLLVISQFTGLYYYFDEQNVYHRSPANPVCFLIPIVIVIIQFSVVIQYRNRLSKIMVYSLIVYSAAPLIAAIIQYFAYGISLVNITMAVVTALLYIYALNDLNHALERAKEREISFYKDEKQKEHTLFEETVETLVSAIDAKDTYTKGHSKRVAEYSRQIADAAGKSEEECDDVFFAAMLHDVGKIGIPVSILNKPGKLTKEEFELIKTHPVVGGDILSKIHGFPYLRIAARYHHERYDGKGYPKGLEGEGIPDIARIIAVADAYDAMSSYRSYRKALPQHVIREEMMKGIGTQFDPKYANIMLNLLDHDTNYQMRERKTES